MTYFAKEKFLFEPLRSIEHGDVEATYSQIGGPTEHRPCLMLIMNTLNKAVFVSVDGINDHLCLRLESTTILDLGTNKQGTSRLFMSVGTRFYVREADGSPSKGVLAITVGFAA